MWHLSGEPGFVGRMKWTLRTNDETDPDGLLISFSTVYGRERPNRFGLASLLGRFMIENGIDWLAPAHLAWLVDLDGLRRDQPDLDRLPWLRGKAHLEPDFRVVEPPPGTAGTYLGNFGIAVKLTIPRPQQEPV